MPQTDQKKHYVRVAYAPDGPGALRMTALLQEHGIDAFRQGGVKDIYKIGGDICGEEIMVAPEDLERAQDVLGQFSGTGALPAPKKGSLKKAILSLVFAAVLLAVLLFLRGRFLT